MDDKTLLTAQQAAEWLHEHVPDESLKYWHHQLANNRRADRSPAHRIPFESAGGQALYRIPDLALFAEFEKSRRLGVLKLTPRAAQAVMAFGIREKGGSTTGRKLTVTAITAQIDDATGERFVQMVTDDPMLVYRISPEQARELSRDLGEAADECERP